jgi:hypothetical protein
MKRVTRRGLPAAGGRCLLPGRGRLACGSLDARRQRMVPVPA